MLPIQQIHVYFFYAHLYASVSRFGLAGCDKESAPKLLAQMPKCQFNKKKTNLFSLTYHTSGGIKPLEGAHKEIWIVSS